MKFIKHFISEMSKYSLNNKNTIFYSNDGHFDKALILKSSQNYWHKKSSKMITTKIIIFLDFKQSKFDSI